MARFFVGQRVKLVEAGMYTELLGAETRITGVDIHGWTPRFGDYLGYELELLTPNGCRAVAPSFCLEPITPSGHAPSENSLHELLPFLKEREKA